MNDISNTCPSSRRRLAVALALVITVGLGAAVSTPAAAKGPRQTTSDTSTEQVIGNGRGRNNTTTTSTTTTTVAPKTAEAETLPTVDLADINDSATSLSAVVEQIGADDLWAAGHTGAGVDVAVIDTGVAPVAELSTTDVFVGPDLSFEGAVDEVAGLDTYGHGTHMIGIIAGRTPGADPSNPQPGDFLGVAPDARIVSVKVADNTGATDVSQVIAAIDWVVQNRNTGGLNIRVLNLSYNTTGTQRYVDDPLAKAVENAWNHGIVVVVSAGNEGRGAHTLANPATNPNVLAVSSAKFWPEWGWQVPSWAPSGDGVRNPDVLAPGVSIASLRVPGSRIDTEHPGGRVDGDDRLFLGSGTSQSAAVVSGAAALLLDQRPDLTPDQIKQLLTSTAGPVYAKGEAIIGNGVIDLTAATETQPGPLEQRARPATGLGSLEAARGDDHVEIAGEPLVGEITVTGAAWDPSAWVAASEAATAWRGDDDWSDRRGPDRRGPDRRGPAPHGPAPHGPAPHGPAAHGPAPHGPAAHGPAPHGPAPHGPAAHGPAPPGPAAHGPVRPGRDESRVKHNAI